jgi:Ca2+-transporting ATPase
MGLRGTDVAREAADLVLLEDDFDSIVKTVRLGRRIYDNIENATGYLVAVHIPTAGMAVLPLLAPEQPADAARAAAFACIVFGDLGLILCNRSRTESVLRTRCRPNRAMRRVFGCTLAGLAAVLPVPALQRLFQFSPIGAI